MVVTFVVIAGAIAVGAVPGAFRTIVAMTQIVLCVVAGMLALICAFDRYRPR